MQFAKYQALGNDYLVVEGSDWNDMISAAVIRLVCDRHFGVGSDGVLVREPVAQGEPFCLRIWNPDGSEAEKSGNGLRIFARYLFDRRCVRDEPFRVNTSGGPVTCQVLDSGRSVTVNMGHARFSSVDIPVMGAAREVLRERITVANQCFEFSAVTLGNPHCVIFRQKVTAAEAKVIGPLIELDPRFPQRTNVQFVEVLDRQRLKIEIWERGAGYTLASGSSSCAAAAVARRLGFCDGSVTVQMPGGKLQIEIDDSFGIRMTGPVEKVAEGQVCEHLFENQTL